MCLRFQFCTHQRVCILYFLKKVKFVVPYCTVPCTATPRNLPLNAKNLADHGPSLPGVKCASRGGGGGGVGYFRAAVVLLSLFIYDCFFVKWFLVRKAYRSYIFAFLKQFNIK